MNISLHNVYDGNDITVKWIQKPAPSVNAVCVTTSLAALCKVWMKHQGHTASIEIQERGKLCGKNDDGSSLE